MRRHAESWILLAVIAALCQTAYADTFGNAGDNFEIEFVTIGNPGNAAESQSVVANQRRGKYQ